AGIIDLTGDQPQQSSSPLALSMDSTPSTGSSVTSATPVSTKSLPSVGVGLVPVSAQALIASTPSAAICSGYCCEVAPMTPSFTLATPGQPPSTDTMSTSFSRPKDLSASYTPAAEGSLMVWTSLMRRSLMRRFYMALRQPSSLPSVSSWPTIHGSVSSPPLLGSPRSMPIPCRNLCLRSPSTVGWMMQRLISAILAL